MYSADFFKKLQQLTQASKTYKQTSSGDIVVDSGEDINEDTEFSPDDPSYVRQQQRMVDVIVYDPITGKAYPNPKEAKSAGVNNYIFQAPSGITVDWSYWDKFKTPATELAAPPPPATAITVEDQTVPFSVPTPPTPTPTPTPKPTAKVVSYEAWQNEATQQHGNPNSKNPGKSLKGDKNNAAMYQNYVNTMNKAIKEGKTALAWEINKTHSLHSGNK